MHLNCKGLYNIDNGNWNKLISDSASQVKTFISYVGLHHVWGEITHALKKQKVLFLDELTSNDYVLFLVELDGSNGLFPTLYT